MDFSDAEGVGNDLRGLRRVTSEKDQTVDAEVTQLADDGLTAAARSFGPALDVLRRLHAVPGATARDCLVDGDVAEDTRIRVSQRGKRNGLHLILAP